MSELYHYGIKGQKWGDRKYQNEDGSLTPEGKIHYGVGDGIKKTKSYKPKKSNIGVNLAKKFVSNTSKTTKFAKKTAKNIYEMDKRDAKVKAKIIGGAAAVATVGVTAAIATSIIKNYSSQKMSNIKTGSIIDADDWKTWGGIKFKDIGGDNEYYNGDSYRYKSKY